MKSPFFSIRKTPRNLGPSAPPPAASSPSAAPPPRRRSVSAPGPGPLGRESGRQTKKKGTGDGEKMGRPGKSWDKFWRFWMKWKKWGCSKLLFEMNNGDQRRSTEIGGALLRSKMQMPAVPGQRAVASTIFLCLTIYNGHIIYMHTYLCVYIYMWGLSYAYI